MQLSVALVSFGPCKLAKNAPVKRGECLKKNVVIGELNNVKIFLVHDAMIGTHC